MSNINNGEEDIVISESEEKRPSEKNLSKGNNKSKEKEACEDAEDKLNDDLDDSDSKQKKNTNGDEIPNVKVIVQTVHTTKKDSDIKITLTEDVSETTMCSSKSIDNLDNINTFNDPVRMSRSLPNNLVLVANPNGTIEAKNNMERIDIGTQGSLNLFHRKDYQVMMFWRGVGGGKLRSSYPVGTVGTMMRLSKVVRDSGMKPGCVLNRITNIMPGRSRCCPVNCNVYVTHVMFFLFLMLLATAYCLNYCLTRPRARYWYYRNWWQIMLSCLTAILFLNYLMFSYMMEKYMALNYICLILAVISCSMFISAISARIESDALWIANAMTACTVLFLFLLSFSNVRIDFTNRMICLIAVLFSLFALVCIVYCNSLYSFYHPYYSRKVLYISGFLGALRVFVMVIELQRLLCSCVASGCCDHAFGAFILYTLYLQFIFFLFQWFPLRRNC